MQTFTVDQVIETYKAHCRMFNAIHKRINPNLFLIDGLTEQEIIMVGELSFSLNGAGKCGSRIKRNYPKAA